MSETSGILPVDNTFGSDALDQALISTCRGEARVLLFSDPAQVRLGPLLDKWRLANSLGDDQFLHFDLRSLPTSPYSPFMNILTALFAKKTVLETTAILDGAGIYHRHRLLFEMALGLTPLDGLDRVEDLIFEEILMERSLLQAAFCRLFATVCHDRVLVVHCQGAEAMGEESLEFIGHPERLFGSKLLLIMDFDGEAPGPGLEQFLREQRSRGLIVHLSHRPSEEPRSSLLEVVPDAMIELLLEFLCFSTVLTLTQDVAPSLRLAIWRARCHEAREEFEEALIDLQNILLADQEGDIRERCTMLRLAARQYRFLNDPEMAVRLSIQARELALESGDYREQVRADFVQFLLISVTAMDFEVLTKLDGRLNRGLERLAWPNHRAFYLGQSAAVVNVFRTKGSGPALARCHQAIRLSRAIGNTRRLGTCWHACAMVHQADGNLRRAEAAYHQIPKAYGLAVLPQELARYHNGHGFLQFSTGQYGRALHSHAQALKLLNLSRHFEESLLTAINVARIQLFAGWPAESRALLESVMVVLDNLKIRDLPFMERETIDSLLGISCLKDGRLGAALEIERRLQYDYPQRIKDPHGAAYRLWFEALAAAERGDDTRAKQTWAECVCLFQPVAMDLRYLAVQVYADQARWLDSKGLVEAARQSRELALNQCWPAPLHEPDRRRLQAELAGLPPPAALTLIRVGLNPQTIIDSVQQDLRLRAWRRSARASTFLRIWQETLAAEPGFAQVLIKCRRLVNRHFLVDLVLLDLPADLPREMDQRYGSQVQWLSGEALEGSGFRTASWIPGSLGDRELPACFIASRQGAMFYSMEDHRVIIMAMRYLETTLLARQRTAELEGRKVALEQSNSQLSVALEQLTLAQTQLIQSEKLAALGSMVAGIAHEINTPIGIAVTGMSHLVERSRTLENRFRMGELLRSDLESFLAGLREGGDIVLRNLYRADRLIQNFKQVATDQTSEEQRPFMLREYLEEVLSSIEPKWKKTAIEVRLEGPPLLQVDSYPGALGQVVTNLVINALVHAFEPEQSGTILLEVTPGPNQGIDLVCADDGVGIQSVDLGRIFDPFFTTKRGNGGTGLGLHIVFNLVHQVLGGTITCDSAPGAGSRFKMWFPRVAPRRAASSDPVKPPGKHQ